MAAHVEGSETFDHAALLDVERRAGFRAYLADPDYKSIAPLRFGSVTNLTILEGPHVLLPPPLEAGTPISLLFQTKCETAEPGARVLLVGPVKGETAPLSRGNRLRAFRHGRRYANRKRHRGFRSNRAALTGNLAPAGDKAGCLALVVGRIVLLEDTGFRARKKVFRQAVELHAHRRWSAFTKGDTFLIGKG